MWNWPVSSARLLVIATLCTGACADQPQWKPVAVRHSAEQEVAVRVVEPSTRKALAYQDGPIDCALVGSPQPQLAGIVWAALKSKLPPTDVPRSAFVYGASDDRPSSDQHLTVGDDPIPVQVLLDIRAHGGRVTVHDRGDTTIYCMMFEYQGAKLRSIIVDDIYGSSS